MLNIFKIKEHSFRSKLGFEKDQEGILKRYLVEVNTWAPHLARTKAVILDQAVTKIKKILNSRK